jgi:hypothetical protein
LQRTLRAVDAPVNIVLGNWKDDKILKNQKFDVVLADYLLGAAEQFWPYSADLMMDRILNSVKESWWICAHCLGPQPGSTRCAHPRC